MPLHCTCTMGLKADLSIEFSMKQGKGQGMQFILPAADHALHYSSVDTVQFSSIIILVIVMSIFFITN